MEQLIAGFHSRLDTIASLNLDNKLKGHLLLCQASLSRNDKNALVGAASGSYDVVNLTTALRNAFMRVSKVETAHPHHHTTTETRPHVPDRSNDKVKRSNRFPVSGKYSTARPTFYTFKTSSDPKRCEGAVLDSGACTSVVGKTTLDFALRALNINEVSDGVPTRESHRFGNHTETHRTLCAVKFPFRLKDDYGACVGEFNIQFDVIDGSLPFLIGLPSLMAMKSNINFKYVSLGIFIESNYQRIPLVHNDGHININLPFTATVKSDDRDRTDQPNGSATC